MDNMRNLINLMESIGTEDKETIKEMDAIQGETTLSAIIEQLKNIKSRMEIDGASEEQVQSVIAIAIQDFGAALFQEIMTPEGYDQREVHTTGNAPGSMTLN